MSADNLVYISHELRSPLIAISGAAKLVKDYFKGEYPDSLVGEMVDEILGSSSRLLSMVNDLLNADKLESGGFTYHLCAVEPLSLVQEVVAQLQPMAGQKDLRVRYWAERVSGRRILVDQERLRQVLINFLSNAIKYTDGGEVGISLEEGAECMEIRIYDTGRGIPPEARGHLFEKYAQADNHSLTADPNLSTGLGLYIAHALVLGMQGGVTLEWSEEGRGTTFLLTFPYAE